MKSLFTHKADYFREYQINTAGIACFVTARSCFLGCLLGFQKSFEDRKLCLSGPPASPLDLPFQLGRSEKIVAPQAWFRAVPGIVTRDELIFSNVLRQTFCASSDIQEKSQELASDYMIELLYTKLAFKENETYGRYDASKTT